MQLVRCLIAGVAIASFTVPALAADPANHNTTRSNKASGIAASENGNSPAGPETGAGENAAPTNHNTTRSNKASGIMAERDDNSATDEASVGSTTRLDGEFNDKYIIEKRKK